MAELNVLTEIEPVSHVIGVPQDIGLGRIAFRPVPFLLEVIIELVGIFDVFHIAAGAGIAVPVPGSTNIITALKNTDRIALAAQQVQQVHTGNPGTDNDDVKLILFAHSAMRYAAVRPPSATRLEPVMKAASSDARNMIAFAMSSTVPSRPMGCRLIASRKAGS